ncbi:MAG: DNA recombination protein RmuC [Ancalomicrobiaceae bacterium]|nr:DNA recombination protein RmuC [Ancalomicrobiaceae bacterium]
MLGSDIGLGIAVGLIGTVFFLLVARGLRRSGRADASEDSRDIDHRLADLARMQEDLSARMQTMAGVIGSRQSDFARHVADRLDGLTHHIGTAMVDGREATHAQLTKLNERLAVIDRAQRGLADLSGHMEDIRAIFSNKQARGAFGQGAMEAIVADCLPAGCYRFQATLSSGARPDCLIDVPGSPPLALDAKFPLESCLAIDTAETMEEENRARGLFRRDMLRHVIDVRDKYLIPGETQDMALLFVPAESVFARLYEEFDDLVQKAHRARVIIVSPTLLVLAVQVVRSLNRDRQIEAAALQIRTEVGHLVADVEALRERMGKLLTHHDQARRDLDQILVAADRITRRGERIGAVEMDTPLERAG